jgi:hypothetical protein
MNTGFYLTLMMGANKPEAVSRSVIDALMGVEVTTTSGQSSGFQLTFALSRRSPLNLTLIPSGYFDPKVRVIITVTLKGTPEVLMDGVITQQQLSPGNEPGQSTLTITGEDLTRMLDLKEHTGKETYPSQSVESRVRSILGRSEYGEFQFDLDVTAPPVKDEQTEQRITPAHRGTDLWYLGNLAEHAGYVFYLEPGPTVRRNRAYWGPLIKTGDAQAALSINLDGHTNVESLNFTYNGFSKSEYLADVLDEDARQIRSVRATSSDAGKTLLGKTKLPALRLERLSVTGKYALNQADAIRAARLTQAADVVTGTGQLDVLRYGRVLKARKLVAVRGAGATYDGLYYVKSVTHNIKRGEYKQSFTLGRDALTANGSTVPV